MNLFKKKALSIKGSALLLVLSLSLAIGVISTALYQSYLHIEIQAIKKNNSIELDLALESLVQYTKKGVSSLWCFDLSEWKDEQTLKVDGEGQGSFVRECSDLSKFLSHKGNVELLLADEKFKQKLRKLVAQKNAETESDDDDITTEVSSCLEASQCNDDEKWIEANIDPGNVSNFNDGHPIKPILQKLVTFSDSVKFKISRLGEKTHNLQGRRWVRISVSVLKSNKLIKELSVEYLMYPRQISSYAFLSANELRLNEDVRSLTSQKDGHTRISQINKSEISQYKGLDVFSPVYVNTNIVLPNKATKFSPVHFKAPVILGKGILKREETDGIKAFSSTDETKFEKKYYTSVDGVSGFSGGIEIRGKKDDGLEKLSDASIEVNYDSLYQCVGKSEVSGTYSEHQIFTKRDNGQYDPIQNPMEGLSKAQTQSRIQNHSKLMIKPLSQEEVGGNLTLKYRLRLTPPNRFRSLPFNSENGESLNGITNPLKSILSLRILSWKYGSKPDGGSYTFNNSKKEDKVFLSWKDAYGGQFINTPAPETGTTPYVWVSGASHLMKGNHMYVVGGGGDVWKSQDGVGWTRISQSFPHSFARGAVVVKGGFFYTMSTYTGYYNETKASFYRSADGVTWNRIISAHTSKRFPEKRTPHVLADDNYIYVIGGLKHSDWSTTKNDVWRSQDGMNWTQVYTPKETDTLKITYMGGYEAGALFQRFSSTIKGDFIYFVGGSELSSYYVHSTPRDDSCSDTSAGTPLKRALIWKYKISENKWYQVTTTLNERRRPTLFTLGNYIYVRGGTFTKPHRHPGAVMWQCNPHTRSDGLWRSTDGANWEKVHTEEDKPLHDKAYLVKGDGSVHFFKDGVSKFSFSPFLFDGIKIKTFPVKEEGFEDSYKNNEIDLSILIRSPKAQNIPSNYKFDFTSDEVENSYFGFIRDADVNAYRKGTSSHTGAPYDFLGMFSNNSKIYFYANKPLYDRIDKIKIRKKEAGAAWKEYKFGLEKSSGYDASDSSGKYWKAASINSGDHIEDNKTYEVEIVTLQIEESNTQSDPTKQTKFVLDFLPYTLGPTDQATKTEEQYWSNQHKDFGAGTTGASSRASTLGKDDTDPSVFSALFKFEPQDFGASTDTYDMPDKASEPDTFTFRAADDISSGGYVGFIKNATLGNPYYRGSSTQTGAPSNFLGMFSNNSKIYFYANNPLCTNIKKIKVRKLGATNWDLYQNFSACASANTSLWRGEDLNGSAFKKDDTYEVEIITEDSENPPTGSLYHDKGANLGNACQTRNSGKGDPKSDNNYIYKSANQLVATGGKTDYSYKDWMTIGKSYYENTNSMKLCAYKSTEEDIDGIETTPCDEKAENKPNPFDALWEEDFLDYTKKSWNFFCSGANGDNAQVRRLSADKEVCTIGSANTFEFKAGNIKSSTLTDSFEYTGFFRSGHVSSYQKGNSTQTGAPSDLLGLFYHQNKIWIYVKDSLYGENGITQIKIRKKGDTNWKTYDFRTGEVASKGGSTNKKYKGVNYQNLRLTENDTYEVELTAQSLTTGSARALSEKEYCSYCKPKETLCIGSGSNCDFTISNNLVSKKTNNSAPQFQKRGLYKKCVVNSSADFVAGFFVCEEFYVASRTKPLNIIGTVVAGKIDIHKQALKKGVSWMSIYHPKAVKLLQDNGILFSSKFRGLGENREIGFTEECKHLFDFNYRNDSIWNAKNHDFYKANSYTCSPTYLTDEDQGNPFSWTQVNPDCIQKRETEDSDSQILCKGRKKHFFMNEISRYLE